MAQSLKFFAHGSSVKERTHDGALCHIVISVKAATFGCPEAARKARIIADALNAAELAVAA